MPTMYVVQGSSATPPTEGIKAHPARGDDRQARVGRTGVRQADDSFDARFAQAQASSPLKGRAARFGDGESAADETTAASPEEKQDAFVAEEEMAAMVIALLAPQTAVWTADAREGTPAADGPLSAGIAVVASDPAARTGETLRAMPQDEAPPEEAARQGIDILEGSSGSPAETSLGPASAARADAPAQGVAEDPAAEAMPPDQGASARMPTEVPVTAWEVERQGARSAPSSLENVDTQAPPSSRVEVTQGVRGRREAGGARAGREEDAGFSAAAQARGPQATESAPFREEPAERIPPARQIAQEAQIQQAMGRARFIMRLQPEALGEVTVRLTLTSAGMTARITTQTEGARQAIVNEIATLGEAMRERGVDVRAVEVLDGGMGHASLLHDGRRGGEGQPRRGKSPAIPAAVAEDAPEWRNLYEADGLTESAGVEVRA